MRSLLSRWLPVLLWMGIIFLVSSQASLPRIANPLLRTILSKTAHFLEYLVLSALLLWAQSPSSRNPGRRAYLIAFIVALAYAISDEFHQSFVPNRRALATDVAIDALGAAVGLVMLRLRGKRQEAQRE